jgi:hypothetical protein
MSLNISKLKNVKQKTDKTTAQCPACAEVGGDAKGEHLVIYSDGKFGCAAHPNDKAHRKEIFRLAGIAKSADTGGPIPVIIRRPRCLTVEPKVICVLHTLARPAVTMMADESLPAQSSIVNKSGLGAPSENMGGLIRADSPMLNSKIEPQNKRGKNPGFSQDLLTDELMVEPVHHGPRLEDLVSA